MNTTHQPPHRKKFHTFTERAAIWTGTSTAFTLALAFVMGCIFTGFFFNFSSYWELVATLVPTFSTFLLVFIIQNSQNRETMAVQIKLNELIRATEGAHSMMLSLEKLSEEELTLLCGQYEVLAEEARRRLKRGETDQGVLEIPLKEAC